MKDEMKMKVKFIKEPAEKSSCEKIRFEDADS